jgi:hypothetical protein
MNLSLIDPFVLAQDYPDTLTEKLSPSAHPALSRSDVANERQEAGTRHVCASIAKEITLLPDEWTALWLSLI